MTKYAKLIAITILLGMLIPANAYAETTASTSSLSKDKTTIKAAALNQRTDAAARTARNKQPAATVNVSKQLMMLGLAHDALCQAMQNGKSLGEYASDQGIEPEPLKRAMTLEMEHQLYEQVQHHQLSTEQRAKLQQHMTQRIERIIDAKK
ncbi:hypothetical protein [Paenibacillus taiwanensis]|uniref:hypothetical protein n=1 Tax=Paenibacillus taiwanensis TaxID=401638 RepID=UPI0003F9D457|nr:hypothetical protein [Paenibacillus taiwanensis]